MKYYLLVKDVMKGSTFLLDLQDECEFKELVHKYSNDTDYEVLECRSVKVGCDSTEGLRIVEARYNHELNKFEYSKLICKMSDGSENIFHFHSRNFMPRIDKIIGMTWDELKAYYRAITDTLLGEIYLEGVDQNKVTKAFLSFSPWEKIESIY